MNLFPCLARLRCAALVALGGGAVAQAMSLWGGQLARFLPSFPVMALVGVAGAGVAGAVLADAFGRFGVRGVLWSVLAWPLATLLGGMIGAAVATIIATWGQMQGVVEVVTDAAPLGILALADAIATSPVVAGVWMLSGLAVHYGARAERGVPI